MGNGKGTWSTHCLQDTRFNMAGRSPGTSHASQAIERAIRDRAQELGVGAAELEKLVIDSFFLQD